MYRVIMRVFLKSIRCSCSEIVKLCHSSGEELNGSFRSSIFPFTTAFKALELTTCKLPPRQSFVLGPI